MGTNCPWNGPFLMSSWPYFQPSFPALSTSWGWFLPFTVSHFDLPGPRYAVAKAQNGNFGDGSRTVWPATLAKSVKMVKTFPPPRTVTSVAWWWAKKNLHFVHSSQSYGGSKSKVSKNGAKVPNFDADLELGSRFGPERGQKRSKSQKKISRVISR